VAAITFGPVADGDDGAEDLAAAGFDDATASALLGGIAVASLAGGGTDLQVDIGGRPGGGVTLGTGAVKHDKPFDARLAAKALDHSRYQGAIIFDHFVFESDADEIAFAEGSGASHSQQGLHVMPRIQIRAPGAREHDGCGDAHRQAHRDTGKGRRLVASSHW
jgi:hypothetical protein